VASHSWGVENKQAGVKENGHFRREAVETLQSFFEKNPKPTDDELMALAKKAKLNFGQARSCEFFFTLFWPSYVLHRVQHWEKGR